MKSLNRIMAVAQKEWLLNLRFVVQFLIQTLVGPIKHAILLLLIYRGFLHGTNLSIGSLNSDNYSLFVLIGTICHGLFSGCSGTFVGRMVTEKWWQTISASLASPLTILELVAGYALGSAGLNLLVTAGLLGVISIFSHIPLMSYLVGLIVLTILCIFSFGIGIIWATFALCFEGKAFIFEYSYQALLFLSCFYIPVQMLPGKLQIITQLLPTYQLGQMIQHVYAAGAQPDIILPLISMSVLAGLVLVIPAFIFDFCIRKIGIVGY